MKKIIILGIITGLLVAGVWYWKTQMSCADEAQCTMHQGEDAHHSHETATMKNTESQKLLDEVMAVHDEVMPQMSKVTDLQKKMSDMAAATKDKTLKNKMLDLSMALEKSDNAMFDWMEKFPEDISKLPEEEAKKLLLNEKTKVLTLKEQVVSAIKQTEDFILTQKK